MKKLILLLLLTLFSCVDRNEETIKTDNYYKVKELYPHLKNTYWKNPYIGYVKFNDNKVSINLLGDHYHNHDIYRKSGEGGDIFYIHTHGDYYMFAFLGVNQYSSYSTTKITFVNFPNKKVITNTFMHEN